MADATIESLELRVESSSQQAVNGLEMLSKSLENLKQYTKDGLGLASIATQIDKISDTAKNIDSQSITNLNGLLQAVQTLSNLGGVKLSSSIANQIAAIGNSAKGLVGIDFSPISEIGTSLQPLTTMGKVNISSAITQLNRIPETMKNLITVDMTSAKTRIKDLVDAIKPLAEIPKQNISSTLTQLKKIPEIFNGLQSVDMTAFAAKINEITVALAPLANEMNKVAAGFSAFPTKIQKLLNSTNQLPKSNNRAAASYVNLAAKISVAYLSIKRIASTLASFINKSNEYIENVNLFNASMGKYTENAQKYAEYVGEAMGIDPGEWMRNQGVFMTLATGFGVVSDRAYIMSKNLTQLGYDLSSFFNISFEDSMQKLQSGISGELEPLRRLGYDLSQAKLQATATSLGIDRLVSSMTQAEKAELRYYAIMTQVTTAQGDMARTLNAPANQLRVLKAQIEQTARAIGNMFIPVLNAIIPYVIAVVKVIRLLVNTIAKLFGGNTLPDIDYSGLSGITSGAEDASDAIGGTTNKVKELKKSLLGIDELNLLTDNSNSAGGGGSGIGAGGSGGFDFELPEYDFLEALTESRVGQIVDKMMEWLGLTDEITSWSDLFSTRLGKILILVGEIGAGLLLWKLSKGLLSGISSLSALKTAGLSIPLTLAAGTVLSLTGFSIEFTGLVEAVKEGLNGLNFVEIILGGLIGTAGTSLLGKGIGGFIAKAFAGSSVAAAITAGGGTISLGVIGAAVGSILAGVPAYIVGIYDALKNGIDWLNAALINIGATATGAGVGAIVGACGGPITAAIGALVGLAIGSTTDIVLFIISEWETLKKGLSTIWGWVYKTVFKPIADFLRPVTSWIYGNIIDPIISFFPPIFNAAISMIVSIYSKVKEVCTGIINAISSVFSKVKEIYLKIVEIAVALGKAAHTYVIQPIFDFIGGLAKTVYDKAIKPVISFFADLGKKAYDYIISPIYDKIIWLRDKAISIFKSIGTTVVNFVSNSFKSVINGVLSSVESTINKFIRMLNSAIGIINKIPGVSITKVSTLSIPRLAEGGMVNSGQMFVAREAGPELVGNVGNKTAVMNNDQIVESVSQGVYEANAEQNALLREQNNLLRQLLDKDSNVTAVIGTNDVINSLGRKNRRDGRTIVPVGV